MVYLYAGKTTALQKDAITWLFLYGETTRLNLRG